MKIREAVQHLADFPEAGDSIPETCFSSVPADIERLRQTLCNPYRIVYETVGDQVRSYPGHHAQPNACLVVRHALGLTASRPLSTSTSFLDLAKSLRHGAGILFYFSLSAAVWLQLTR